MNSRLMFQKCTFVLCFELTLFAAKNYSFVFCACVHPKVWLGSGFEIAFFTSKCLSIMLWGSVNSQCIFWTCLMPTLFTRKNDSLVFFLGVCFQIAFLTCLVFTLITREPWIFMNASYMVSYLNLLVCLISTFIAAIWPFFAVYHDMFFKIPCVIAGKVTKVTFVWFLIHMHLHVPKEHRSSLSNISARIASQSPGKFSWM